jgi:hypothetical protein
MNIDNYLNSKQDIVKIFFQQKGGTNSYKISMIAVCYHIPVIACLFWVGEALDWPEDILKSIDFIVKDYQYKNIIGIPSSYPGERV